MTDRYVVFKITSERGRKKILDWAQYHKSKGKPALFRVIKEILTVFLQEYLCDPDNSCPVDWFVECSGLISLFLTIHDWGLSESIDTLLFGRYNLDTTLEFIGALDSLPEYKRWLAGHSESDILRQHKLNLEPEEKMISTTKSDEPDVMSKDTNIMSKDINIMAENTQLKLENDKLRLLAEQLDKDRAKLRADLDELRREFDQFIKKSRGGVEDEAFD